MKKLLFTLACAFVASMSYAQVISSFPYTEDFEGQPQGPTACGPAFTTTGNTWQNGGAAVPAIATHQTNWTADSGGTDSGGTGPTANGGADHTTGTSLGRYMYCETSCPGTGFPTREFDLVSPYMDFTTLTAPEIEFWYHAFGTTQGNLNVLVQVGALGSWANVAGPITDNFDAWQLGTASLLAYAGMDSVRVQMNYISGSNYQGDIALDDISVSQTPEPYDLSGLGFASGSCGTGPTAVSVEFQCAGSDTIFAGDTIYFNYDDGITAFEDTLILSVPCAQGDTITHTFSTLINYVVSTPINMMVWSTYSQDFGSGNDTIWTTVNPIPVISSFPYLENFEAGQGGWVEDNTINGSWAFGTPAKTTITGAASGNNAFTTGGLGVGQYNPNENGWVLGPCFDFTTLDSGSYVGVKVWWNSEFSWDGGNIQWSEDDGASWNNIGVFGSPNNWYTDNTINGNPGGNSEGWTGRTATSNGSNGWVQAKHALPNSLVGIPNVNIRFTFGSDGAVHDDGIAFDDFSIGLPDSLDSAMFMDFAGCSDLDLDYLKRGFYSWAIQDTASLLIDTTFFTYDGMMSFVNNAPGTDTTFNLIVNYVDPSGCFPFVDTMLITIGAVPIVSLADTSICFDGTAAFNVTADPLYNYTWSDTTTLDNASFTAGGMVGVTVIDTVTGCAATDSALVTISAVDLGVATANVCAGDSLLLDAGTFNSYAWSTTEVSQSIYVSAVGMYVVTVTDSLGCVSSDSTDITTSLPVPAITGLVDTICANGSMILDAGAGFSSYSWTTSGSSQSETVNGASLPLGDNTVTVTVTDANGCSNTDAVTFFIDGCASIDELKAIAMTLFPNPSAGVFNYAIDNMTGRIDMMIVDVTGKIITAGELSTATGIIDLSTYETGVYILKLNTGDAITTVRLIKQ